MNNRSYAVIGLGQFGMTVALTLADAGCDVLAIDDREENVQDIAEALSISRAALYRHIAGLNEKTGTKSRIGLLQFYYGWKEKENV